MRALRHKFPRLVTASDHSLVSCLSHWMYCGLSQPLQPCSRLRGLGAGFSWILNISHADFDTSELFHCRKYEDLR